MPDPVADLRTQAEQARQSGDFDDYMRLSAQADDIEATTPLDPHTDNPFRGVANPPASFRDALGVFFDEGTADRIEATANELEVKADEAGAALFDARDKLNELIAKDGPNTPRVKIAERAIPGLEAAYEDAKATYTQAGRSAVQVEEHLAAAERAIGRERQPKLQEAEGALAQAKAEADRLHRTPTATAEQRLGADQLVLDATKARDAIKVWAEAKPTHAEKRERLQAQVDAHDQQLADYRAAFEKGVAGDEEAMAEAMAARVQMSG